MEQRWHFTNHQGYYHNTDAYTNDNSYPHIATITNTQLSPTATPVGSSGSISGDVKDGDGNVLQGVTVTIVGGERPFALTREYGNGCKWKV